MSSTTTNESEEGMLSKDQADSPSFDEVEGSCGGFVGGSTLKKGPWTSAEDAILVDYVKKHGEGNWNAVQKHSGLFRCGKSCRLRWANHLRPNLKKGAFTSEEENLIIELHSKMGNKWARMAAHLPGRTDNEIKNYWNTRIKRLQRSGLPLYPPDLCMRALHENRRGRNANEYSSGDAHHIMQGNNFEIPEVVFEHLKGNQSVLSYAPPLPDFSIGSMLHPGFSPSQSYNFLSATTMHCPKRFRGSDLLPGPNQGVQHQNDSFGKLNQHFGLSFPYDPDPNAKNFSIEMLNGSHANVVNGNFSTSKPVLGSLKMELPSLQYPETDLGTWGTSSSPQPPSLDSVDAFIRSPSPTRASQPDCDGVSPRNSGLLDALLHESQTLGSAKNQSSEKSSSSCVVTPGIMDSPRLNLCGEWEDYGDPISPLGRSAASVFSDHTPLSGASPVLSAGSEIKQEPVDNTPDSVRQPPSTRSNFLRPDALLEGSWFGHSLTESCKEHSILNDAISNIIGDDICDYKQTGGNTVVSYPWNNLPAVYQMSELP